ncbi:hypothetical protein BS17DRAFT_855216, partial [Gyrodon lividus]
GQLISYGIFITSWPICALRVQLIGQPTNWLAREPWLFVNLGCPYTMVPKHYMGLDILSIFFLNFQPDDEMR